MDEQIKRVLKGEKLADVLGHTKKCRKMRHKKSYGKHRNTEAYIRTKKAFDKFWSK